MDNIYYEEMPSVLYGYEQESAGLPVLEKGDEVIEMGDDFDFDGFQVVRRECWIAVGLRFVWVIISYFYYKSETGIPFEFSAADSIGYHGDGEWLATQKFDVIRRYLIEGQGLCQRQRLNTLFHIVTVHLKSKPAKCFHLTS